jgi:hypothetical protein
VTALSQARQRGVPRHEAGHVHHYRTHDWRSAGHVVHLAGDRRSMILPDVLRSFDEQGEIGA